MGQSHRSPPKAYLTVATGPSLGPLGTRRRGGRVTPATYESAYTDWEPLWHLGTSEPDGENPSRMWGRPSARPGSSFRGRRTRWMNHSLAHQCRRVRPCPAKLHDRRNPLAGVASAKEFQLACFAATADLPHRNRRSACRGQSGHCCRPMAQRRPPVST